MKKATIKKPNFEDFSDDSESSPPSSPLRRAKAISPPMRPTSRSRNVNRDNIQQPLASGSRRQTVNSLTAHDLVYNARLPPPNTEVRIPPPPSRAPTPPTQAIPHNRGGYKFTPEDKEFFVRFIQWRLQDPVPITRNMLCEELAEKVPHHTTASWTAYWQNNHDLPDKILAAAWNRYYDAGGTTGPLPKPDNPEQSASGDEGDSENDDDLEIPTDDKSAMGEKGGPYTQADLGVMCRYVASFSETKWDALSAKERWGPFANRYKERMDETYDVIVLGTGLTECILSGLLSVEGKKVLHMDRNDYYGGDSASLNLTQLYRKFRTGQEPPSELGRDRDYAVDLIPKFIIASGELTKILVHTDVTRYLEFKQIAGSFVYRDGKISKVPSTEMEAVRSPLMGLFEKRRAKKFFEFLQGWKDEDPATHQGINLDTDSMKTVYEKFGLEPGTQDFIGHAMALYLDDDYITKPARPTYDRIVLYTSSMARYGKSPYIYPLYGLGELPPIDEVVTDADGNFVGVTSGGETVKAKQVIGDPSYFGAGGSAQGGKVRVVETGRVVRAICILKHPIPNTEDSDSCQIIIPQNQVGRRNDIYVAMVSSTHNVCAKDIYVAIVSTIVETDNPHLEIVPGLNLLGPIHEQFLTVTPLYTPTADGKADNIFITRSYDATSHFETVVEDVQDVWKRVIGSDLVLKKREEMAVQE
ncbi:Rab GDP dissociation inhibitor [Mycena kentingensis (nom. inval.)]|nr:Rab GDP dissociation inhibitor [Mycena kentingensis (nom. inval.)]